MGDFQSDQFHDQLRADIRRRMWRHRHHPRHSGVFGVLVGVTILLVGVLFLLENFGLIHVHQAWQYWPAILIALGVARATDSRRSGGILWGGVIALAGVFLLLGNLQIVSENVWKIVWPLLLIGVGLRILYRTVLRRRRLDQINRSGDLPPGAYDSASPRARQPGQMDEWAVFSGSRRRMDSQDFKGGAAFAMFGGVELDLRPAAIQQEEVVIEASALFGGIDIQVPQNWNVVVEGHGIFGGYDDQTLHVLPEDARPRVVIVGNAVFGGVVVKN